MWSSWVRLQPDSRAVAEQQVETDKVGDHAEGGGDHGLGIDLNRLLGRAALVAAVGVLAVETDDLGGRAARHLLDLAGQLNEGEIQIFRQHAAKRRFPHPPQPDQGDDPEQRIRSEYGARTAGPLPKIQILCGESGRRAQRKLPFIICHKPAFL